MKSENSYCCESEHLNLTLSAAALQNEDKHRRMEMLKNIKCILEKSTDQSCVESMYKTLHTYILQGFNHKAESCRELSVDIVNKCISILPLSDYYLTYIIPVIVKRVGQPETIEGCEELRLKIVILLKNIITQYKDSSCLSAFFNDFTTILTKTCQDSFPKVKIESNRTIVLLSESIKRDFHMQSESFIKPIISNFSHQQCPVRTSAVNALGASVSSGSTKCLEESFTPMAEKLFDDKFEVRMSVIENVGQWMLNHKDRYSFWHRMIPLLLTGLNDVQPEVVNKTKELWNAIGVQYINENEDQLKDKLDFDRFPPLHYPSVERPNLGCRILVERNIGKIIPAIINELDGWKTDARLRSVQLLTWLVLHAETSILQHAPIATKCFFLGAKNDDVKVNNEVYRASELLGYFVSPDIWWELLSPEVDEWACLGILSNIIKGTEPEKLQSVYLKKIVKKLSKPDRCRTLKWKYQTYLLETCENLMDMCGRNCEIVGQEMFNILFTVLSLAEKENIRDNASGLLRKLATTLDCGSTIPDISCKYMESLLGNITSDAHTWNMQTPDRCILQAIVIHTGKAIGNALHLLAPLVVEVSGENVDAEVKLRLFTNLSSVLLEKDEYLAYTSLEHLNAFLKILLEDVISPNLVWYAGKSAETIRTSAVVCLCAVLQNIPSTNGVQIFSDVECLESYVDKLLPLLAGILDDQANQTHLYTMRAICCITTLAKENNIFTSDHLHKIYPAVMKKLDGGNDSVRLAAVQTLCLLFVSRPDSYDASTFQSHLDAVYSAMLIHLDDPSEGFGQETLVALKALSEIHPKLLKNKIQTKMNLFKNKLALESLDKHLESLVI